MSYNIRKFLPAFTVSNGTPVTKAYGIPNRRGKALFTFYMKTEFSSGSPTLTLEYLPVLKFGKGDAYGLISGATLLQDVTRKKAKIYKCLGGRPPVSSYALTNDAWYMVEVMMDGLVWDMIDFRFTEESGTGDVDITIAMAVD